MSLKRLSGEVALVSGGASGIGRATCLRLADEGAKVMVCDVDQEGGKAAAAELGDEANFHRLNVTDSGAWSSCVEQVEAKFGALSILVNAAGILRTGGIDTELERWRQTMSVNLDAVFYGCRAGVRAMMKTGRGAIVNLASTSGIRADPRTAAYDASKAGVRSLTKEIAVYCARCGTGIRCNSVHPGSVDTAMMQTLAEGEEETYRDWVDASPMGRLADPAEIAGLIAFLVSDEAAFITGAEYVIDGGAIV